MTSVLDHKITKLKKQKSDKSLNNKRGINISQVGSRRLEKEW